MTLDHESFKNSSSGNTLMKMKKSAKAPAYNFAKYFKVLPSQFVESFTTRLWKRKQNLPSSVFEPKINPNTLLYRDLRRDMKPTVKDHPLLAFQALLVDATGVPYPNQDPKNNDLKVVKREVRVSMFDTRRNIYIANSAIVSAMCDSTEPDKWKFNAWKAVGTNPLIFTSKDKEVVDSGDVDIIFEFVIVCKGSNNATKDISCGYAPLHLKDFKVGIKPKSKYLDIKGGSPDQPIEADPFDFKEGLGMWKKMKRGTITSRIKVDFRYFQSFSQEGKFYCSMLPSTCVINKKLVHFLAGYRCYQAKTLCKETTDSSGFVVASGDHIILTFPFVLDNPDVREKILVEWHNNVSKGIAKSAKQSQKNVDYIILKSEAYISRIYLIKYADNFNVIEGKEFESAVNDEIKYKLREELITYALKADMPNVHYSTKKKLEAISTFKPFNIKELEVDVSSKNRIMNHQKEFEQKGLRVRSTKRKRDDSQSKKSKFHGKDKDEEDKNEESKYKTRNKYDKEDKYGKYGKENKYDKYGKEDRYDKERKDTDFDRESHRSHKSHRSHRSSKSREDRRHRSSKHGSSKHGESKHGESKHGGLKHGESKHGDSKYDSKSIKGGRPNNREEREIRKEKSTRERNRRTGKIDTESEYSKSGTRNKRAPREGRKPTQSGKYTKPKGGRK